MSGTVKKAEKLINAFTVFPFLVTAGIWLLIGIGLSVGFSESTELRLRAAEWMGLLWLICIFDIFALAKTISAVIGFMTDSSEKRVALGVQALYWGVIKLVCLGLFVGVLLIGQKIPTLGLIPGTGTMVVVPLFGGFWWSQRILRHA